MERERGRRREDVIAFLNMAVTASYSHWLHCLQLDGCSWSYATNPSNKKEKKKNTHTET